MKRSDGEATSDEMNALRVRLHRANGIIERCDGWLRLLKPEQLEQEAGYPTFRKMFDDYYRDEHATPEWDNRTGPSKAQATITRDIEPPKGRRETP